MRTFLIITLVVLVSIPMTAQYYYWGLGNKIYMDKSSQWTVVQLRSGQAHSDDVFKEAGLKVRERLRVGHDLIWLDGMDNNNLQAGIAHARARGVSILRTFPSFIIKNPSGTISKRVLFDEFVVKFKTTITETQIRDLCAQYGVEVISKNPYREYVLRVTESSPYQTLDLANTYYERGLAEWSQPNFIADIHLDSDPLYPRQWYLNDTGQVLGGPGGVDIFAERAWMITTGSSSVVVAVVDNGVEAHEDFSQGQLLAGYTAGSQGGDGSPCCGNAHGQAVAGIIAGNHNSTGIRGVTTNSKIMPINIFPPYSISNADIAAAIDTAWVRGADILNNSWSMESYPGPQVIVDAIQRALTSGRGEKGCLVVGAAGNNGRLTTEFPANYKSPENDQHQVVAVGAVTYMNVRAPYSPMDSLRIDVVAPSGYIAIDQTSEIHLDSAPDTNIISMDLMGSAGTNSGNYTYLFGGTSAAAPQVSGAGALLLAYNPDLTSLELVDLIKSSAFDYGATNWDGSGRLNAAGALVLAGADCPWCIEKRGRQSVFNPTKYSLRQNYPNPFNPSTELVYELAEDTHVRLTILDVLGREVKTLVNETQAAGRHTVSWDADHFASGVYFYRLAAGKFTSMNKMVLSR